MKISGHSKASEVSLRISPNALRVLQKRYLAKDETGKVIETPEGMFRRVAANLLARFWDGHVSRT